MRICATVAIFVIVFSSSFARADGHVGGASPLAPENLYKEDGSRIPSGCFAGLLRLMKDAPGKFGWAARALAATQILDKPSFSWEIAYGERVTYVVDFSESCNLHNAGYQGRFKAWIRGQGWIEQPLVYDKILSVKIDYSAMSREDVDEHFRQDMRAECEQQIGRQGDPRGRRIAIQYCQEHGTSDPISTGAETLYDFARKHGDQFYHQ